MKAILEFNLPEEQPDHEYAIHGVDALLCIDDLFNEIRSKLNHDCGRFKEWDVEIYNEDGTTSRKKVHGCDYTLERVRDILVELTNERNLPDLV